VCQAGASNFCITFIAQEFFRRKLAQFTASSPGHPSAADFSLFFSPISQYFKEHGASRLEHYDIAMFLW